MAEKEKRSIWVTTTFFFSQWSSCQNGFTACNMIHCKFYMEEINVVKAVHISVKSEWWPVLTMRTTFGCLPQCVWLISLQNIKRRRGERIWFIEAELTVLLLLQSSHCFQRQGWIYHLNYTFNFKSKYDLWCQNGHFKVWSKTASLYWLLQT